VYVIYSVKAHTYRAEKREDATFVTERRVRRDDREREKKNRERRERGRKIERGEEKVLNQEAGHKRKALRIALDEKKTTIHFLN